MTIVERVTILIRNIFNVSNELYNTRVAVVERDGKWTDEDHMNLLRTTENLANQLRNTVKTIEKLNTRIEELESQNH